jgi:beta-RFAP synthase
MHGGLGRRFGSLGLAISGVATRLTATRSDNVQSEGPGCERAARVAVALLGRLGLDGGVTIHIQQTIPEHVGLGSGTQMALAVGAALGRLYGCELPPESLATLTGRGLRSGIGLGAFVHGGFIVDAGRGQRTVVPPIISRMPFPDHWRVLLVFDHTRQGVHGERELEAFAHLPEMRGQMASDLCRRVLVQMLPALAEADFATFAEAVTVFQDAMGDLFSRAQGGCYASPRVAAALDDLRAAGVRGIGQSSWGPTGFALFERETEALAAQHELRGRYREASLELMVVRGLNRGALVEQTTLRQDAMARTVMVSGRSA